MPFRDAATVRTAAIQFLDDRQSGIRTEAGEPVMDLVDAFSIAAGRLHTFGEYLRSINSIAGWRRVVTDEDFKEKLADALNISATSLDTDFARRLGAPTDLTSDVEALIYVDLNNFAASYGRRRKEAQFATGTIRLFLNENAPYSLPRGQSVKTGGVTQSVLFDTSVDLVGTLPAFDLARNAFYVEVAVRARVAGTSGNQIANAINSMVGAIQGVFALTNPKPTESGTARETNEALLDALEGVLQGASKNNHQGLKNFIQAQDGVQDVAIIGPAHPLMERATAGAVDIYIIGSRLVTQQVNIRVITEGETVVLPYQPVRDVNAVVDTVTLLEYTPGGGYTLDEDDGTFEGSAQEQTAIVWAPTPTGPPAARTVQVNFTYNALIRDLQLMFDDDPEHEIPGSAYLIKESIRLDVDFEMKVVAVPEVTQSQAEQAVQSALITFLSSFIQGKDLDYSDVFTIAAEAELNGVKVADRIDGFKMGLSGTTLGIDNLTAQDNEHFRLFSVTFLAP